MTEKTEREKPNVKKRIVQYAIVLLAVLLLLFVLWLVYVRNQPPKPVAPKSQQEKLKDIRQDKVAELKQQLEQDGGSAQTKKQLAHALAADGQYQEAAAVYDELGQLDTTGQCLIAARVYAKAGDKAKATAALDRGVVLANQISDPESREVALNDMASYRVILEL